MGPRSRSRWKRARRQDRPAWLDRARTLLARAPAPAPALRLAAGVLDAAPPASSKRWRRATRTSSRTCCTRCAAIAPFLATDLLRRPAWLLALLDEDLTAPRTREALEAALEARSSRGTTSRGAHSQRPQVLELGAHQRP